MLEVETCSRESENRGGGGEGAAHADSVDVRLVARECLPAGPLPHVPELGAGITGPRNEEFEVRGHGQAHAVPRVSHKHSLLLPGLDVPQSTAGVGEGNGRGSQRKASTEVPPKPQHPQLSILTTWCPRSWSQCCCRPGSGSRRDNLRVVRTVSWLPAAPCRAGASRDPQSLTHLCEQRAPG